MADSYERKKFVIAQYNLLNDYAFAVALNREEMKRVYDDPAANVTYEDQSSSSTHWMHPEAFHTSRALNSIIPSSLNKTYILWQYDLEITEMFEELVKMFSYDEKDNNIILNQ
ncbi:3341_t:CDS:2 [Entrophospora sp. SA101]|nr:3341_t:CDS:2 [Entrophospora sp. SA101]CAJ0824778.1 12313_t:CDS:2 [Entrophospora sp. SA101]CAJ0846026.1 17426_t:CDS:2 [Entrophospora sp. SA101]